MENQKKVLDPFEEFKREEARKKEAARRIVEMSGELHLSLNDLDCVRDYLRQHAGLGWVD